MTYGLRTINNSGVVNIDENSKAYVYLGKYGPFGDGAEAYGFTCDITCAGFPLIFISVPHDVTLGESPLYRNGIAVVKVENVGTNTWRVTTTAHNASTRDNVGYQSFNTFLRVFGRLDLNFPDGSGDPYGLRVFSPSGELVFDSAYRMLRLAGNTYDTELVLSRFAPGWAAPLFPLVDYNAYDTQVNLPFSMAGKSICANVGPAAWTLTSVSSFLDVDNQLNVRSDLTIWGYGFWSSGNTLWARRIYLSTVYIDSFESYPSNGGESIAEIRSRLAIIDNSQFP